VSKNRGAVERIDVPAEFRRPKRFHAHSLLGGHRRGREKYLVSCSTMKRSERFVRLSDEIHFVAFGKPMSTGATILR